MSGREPVVINKKLYYINSPNLSQKQAATEVYEKALEETKYVEWFTDWHNKRLLVSMGYITPEIDENFKEIEERIEDLKVELYESIFDSTQRDKTRKMLTMVKNKHVDMIAKRHYFDSVTREGYANIVATQYLMAATLTDGDGVRIYADEEIPHASFSLIDKIISVVNQNTITEPDIRFIARSDKWRGYWVCGKAVGNPFGKSAVDLSDNQRLLCQLTRMYDNAYEHPDCPDTEVIEDDDAFDGWLIKERRKAERNKGERLVDEVTGGKHKDAHEVFLVAGSEKDRKKIESLNDARAKMVKKQRSMAMSNAGGTIHEGMLPDQQVRIQTEATRLMAEAVRSNKGK